MPSIILKTRSYYLHQSHMQDLANKWASLQDRANSSVFISWFWIKQWLAQKDLSTNNCLCIEVKLAEQTVGLALFGIKTKKVFWGLSFKQYFLHKSGNIKEDQTWIEHNTFLTDKNYEQQIIDEICQQLAKIKQVDDIKIGLSSSSFIKRLHFAGFKQRTELASQGYLVNLAGCHSLEDYLATLSKNTRSNIKRSIKLLNQQSPLQLTLATDPTQKGQVLEQIAELHRLKWRTTVYGSGFDNPTFYDFHRALIQEQHSAQNCRLFTLYQEDVALGYVYLLTQGDRWSFYLSALHFNSDNRIKVGLVMHSLIIEQAIKLGVSVYDFLAGEAQYKNSLSNAKPYEQNIYCFYRDKPLLLIREQLRKYKRMLFGRFFSNIRTKIDD